MARGRKPKEFYDAETDVQLHSKHSSICELCGAEIYVSPRIVRLNDLTGCAVWRRDTKVDRLNICDKCAFELNELIDKFIIEKNSSLSKFN